MKTRIAAAAATTGLAVSAMLAGSPVGAQEEGPLPLTVEPTSGADAVFDVSGTGCLMVNEDETTTPGVIRVFVDGQDLSNFDPNNPDLAEADGSWIVGISPEGGTPPPGVIEITATCTINDGTGTDIVTYAPATYEILAGETPTTEPETTPTTEPPAEDDAAPAAPVVAEPTYTG